MLWDAIEIDSEMAVGRVRLRQLLEGLLDRGYRCLSLEEFLTYQEEGRHPNQPSFLITFDDGYLSNYSEALPLLEELDISATLSITSHR